MSRRPKFFSRLFDPGDIDPESRNKLLLVGGVTAVVVISAALILVGYFVDRSQTNNAVFSVGERTYDYDYLKDRVNAAVHEGTFDVRNFDMSIALVVRDIQNEELFRLKGRDMGFEVTEEEIDEELKRFLNVSPEIGPNELASVLRQELLILGLSADQLREILAAQLFDNKVRASLDEALPDEIEHVRLRIIMVQGQEQMTEVLERLESGDAFEDIATEMSQHSSAEEGGDFGWTPPGLLPPELEAITVDLEPGEVSEPGQTSAGLFIFRAEEREVRELEPADRTEIVARQVGNLLDEALEEHGIENMLTFEQVQRIANQIEVPRG